MKKLLKASCQKTKKNVDHILFNNFLIHIIVFFFCHHYNWCFLKSGVEVGVEESIVNAPPNYNSDQLFKSYLNFYMFLICSLINQSFLRRVVHSQSTFQRQLGRQI
jgi:hypothetical protein